METVEPWLRGTLGEVDAVRRQVLHALEQAGEDVERWCGAMRDAEMNARPLGLPPLAFHLRHIARSLGRLLGYLRSEPMSPAQHDLLASEMTPGAAAAEVLEEFRQAVGRAMEAVRAVDARTYNEPRGVGRKALPSTVGGLMVHVAEHTQRHVGQAITTAKVVRAMSPTPV